MIKPEEKEVVANRLRKWLNDRPELKHPPLYKHIRISQSSWSNFMLGVYLIRFEKMVALEKLLSAKFGYNRKPIESLPESFVEISERMPPKKGDYLVRGKTTDGKVRTKVGTYNGQRFYNCSGVKVHEWRSIPI